ncbi:agmatinase family protein [Natrinema sp. 1APR25-10V2]|uniref:agmatinase family protein n=1 Tax=Natrinema sp. 1APR25-10V2 TaxID=2951081 RepID=UPI00287B85CD|nr:agmatinase family protein [Natrinema sp. 1APR25-10V2]
MAELSYAGIQTFLKSETCAVDELHDGIDIAVLGVPFDGAVTRRPGARFGPAAVRAASGWYAYLGNYKGGVLNVETDRVVSYDGLTVRDCGDVDTVPTSIGRTRPRIEAAVEVAASSSFPVLLGGDHYVTYPSYLGFARAMAEPVGVIQIDAHTDTVDSSPLHGEHFHGSPMARIDESEYGSYENHAMIGIRAYEGPEFATIEEERDLHVSYASDVDERGIESCVRDAIDHVTDGVDHVYLTVDIDGVDPSFAPGTGTPEPGGLTSGDLLQAMDLLGQCDEIGMVDMMEVAPKLDPTESTQRLAANALVRFIESKFLKDMA